MEDEKLTRQQQKSLFKWLGMIADELNENGITLQAFLHPAFDIHPTKKNLHESFVKQLIEKQWGYKSTTELKKKKEIDKIIDIVTLHCSEKFGITAPPFPSEDERNLVNSLEVD